MRLTDKEKEQVVERYLSGESVKKLMKEKNFSRSTLYLWAKQYQEQAQEDYERISVKKYRLLQKRVERLEEMIDIFKEANCKYNDSVRVKLYALETLYSKHSIHILCETFGVARGTFYNHILRNKKENTSYAQRKEELRIKIEEIYNESNQIFGAGKIMVVLKSRGVQTSENMVRMLMREMGISSVRQEAKSLYDKEQKSCRNKLQQQFTTTAPNQVWVSDITYFRYKDQNYYICVIIDLFARKVIGYKVGTKNSTQLTKSTFQKAYAMRKPNKGLTFHSDNGNNYRAYAFCKYLKSLSVEQSFSRPYVPYDNSVMESFFASMKREELYRRKYNSENELFRSIDDYIVFYNDKRPHYKNSYKTPTQKEAEYYEKN